MVICMYVPFRISTFQLVPESNFFREAPVFFQDRPYFSPHRCYHSKIRRCAFVVARFVEKIENRWFFAKGRWQCRLYLRKITLLNYDNVPGWKNMTTMPWSCHDHTIIMAKQSWSCHDDGHVSWHGRHDSWHNHGTITMFSMIHTMIIVR